MPKKTTTLFAGAQVAAALKQGSEGTDGQKMAEKSVAKGGAVGIVHSPRTSKMMEDRAGKTAGSATNKMQSFNGLGEPVGFLQVFHGASKGYPWCRGPLSGQGWAGFNTTPTPTMTLGPRCTTYDPAYAEADVRSDNDHHHVHVGACLHYHFHGNGGAFEKCAWMVPINSSPGSNVQCTPVPSGVTPNPFPGWKCRVNSDKSCTAVPEGR